MTGPLVSIITPVYNAERFLSVAVRSVQGQTYQNWELWLVDDCSTDHSTSLMHALADKDPRIRLLFLDKNSGAGTARNTAIVKSAGRYIAFIDADDVWKKEKLEMQISFMQKNKAALSFSYYEMITEKGELLDKIIKCPPFISYKKLLRSNTIGCLTAVYDSELTGKMFMPDVRKRQDWGLWLDILRKGFKGYGIQQSLAYYRTGADSLSGNKLSVYKYNWEILRKYQNLSFIKSSYYFMSFVIAKTIKYLT